jgi:prenyltransferase beta subunit
MGGSMLSLLLVAGALLFCVAAPARADEAAPEIARYDAPIDKSVDRALAYLAGKQLKDGSFECPMRGNSGVTSLCVMAFLAKGNTPGRGPYGEMINRGVDFVLANQKDDGLLIGPTVSHGPMYSHLISTLMLSEVSGMVDPARQKLIDAALSKAVKLTLAAQRVVKSPAQQGGWRYQHTSGDSDMSVTGWALMGLRSCRNNGAPVPRQAVQDALNFVMNCRCPDGGFGYTGPNEPLLARTGTALLCLELCGRHEDKSAVAAGEWILANLPKRFGGTNFYYGVYYCTQGMFQLGGKYWRGWAEGMYDMMLKNQQADGAWPAGESAEAPAGDCYSTAMGVLAMSVSYRQLPIYQR